MGDKPRCLGKAEYQVEKGLQMMDFVAHVPVFLALSNEVVVDSEATTHLPDE